MMCVGEQELAGIVGQIVIGPVPARFDFLSAGSVWTPHGWSVPAPADRFDEVVRY